MTCPVALLGVTQVQLGPSYVKRHHHLLHTCTPCARCFAPEAHDRIIQGEDGAFTAGQATRTTNLHE
ncbi:hypothetical protein PHMEG_00016100 [Phytophthora megakarya]|uniref:Uncharacterized protein n=1 Tax=Phytophthora megakarya TaxID=4795 RepID=A0A225W0Q8_9STRA|nr:hypothetical protein PHMEG_00016100 [Phytophthora megakarya]